MTVRMLTPGRRHLVNDRDRDAMAQVTAPPDAEAQDNPDQEPDAAAVKADGTRSPRILHSRVIFLYTEATVRRCRVRYRARRTSRTTASTSSGSRPPPLEVPAGSQVPRLRRHGQHAALPSFFGSL